MIINNHLESEQHTAYPIQLFKEVTMLIPFIEKLAAVFS